MIRIQLGNDWLDTYADENVELSWEAFRFQKGLRAGYTNDLDIPKTTKNLSILQAVGLLDRSTQPFGTKTAKCVIQLELRMLPIHIQVAAVNAENIKICLYEDAFPEKIKDKTLRNYFIDNPSTILLWNEESMTRYPDQLRVYDYGMPYDTLYAQRHPVTPVNALIQGIASPLGVVLPQVDNNWYAMSTRKVVCPQNNKQMVEGICDRSTGNYMLSGGQHITNNLTINYGDGQAEIVFNRSASIHIDIWVSWFVKNSGTYSFPFVVNYNENGTNITHQYNLRGDLYRNKIDFTSLNLTVNEGGKLTFALTEAEYFDSSDFIADITLSDYQITEDDYDEELAYIARRPRLFYYDWNSNSIIAAPWNGVTFNYSWKERGVSGSHHSNVGTFDRSLSYFGIYCNLPDIKVSDFLYSLQWAVGKKMNFDHKKTITWRETDESAVIDGYITEIRPKSDRLGQKNYIKFQDDENPLLVSRIKNAWLSPSVNVIESKFGRVTNISQFTGKINQYSNPTHEDGSNEYKCDFNEINSLTLWWKYSQSGPIIVQTDSIRDIPVNTLGLETLTQSLEVDITTFTPQLRDKDFVYLDGRKFFIVTCKTDLETQRSQLTCLCVPTQNTTDTQLTQINEYNQ